MRVCVVITGRLLRDVTLFVFFIRVDVMSGNWNAYAHMSHLILQEGIMRLHKVLKQLLFFSAS